MLSSVLRSPMAIATNIHIMRAFNAMRHFIGSHAQVFQRLEVVERVRAEYIKHRQRPNMERCRVHISKKEKMGKGARGLHTWKIFRNFAANFRWNITEH